jgi:serine/threonine protein kinase
VGIDRNWVVDQAVQSSSHDPLIGQSFGSDKSYKIIRFLGSGGGGRVYEAAQTFPNRHVAVKVLPIKEGSSAEPKERFRREIETTATLTHPHVLPVYEAGEFRLTHSETDLRFCYYTMLLAKTSLKACLRDRGEIDGSRGVSGQPNPEDQGETLESPRRKVPNRFYMHPDAVVRLMIVVAEAVQFAHERGVIHRDLKPHNVLLADDDVPYVADFGLAKREEGENSLTVAGGIVGTDLYRAPESNRETPRADVYGLGAILHVMLTGVPPRPEGRNEEGNGGHPLADPLDSNANVPARLKWICRKCLQAEPGDRFGSAKELAGALRNFVEANPQSGPTGPKQPLLPLLTAGAVGLLVLAASCLVLLRLSHLEEKLGTSAESATDTDPKRLVLHRLSHLEEKLGTPAELAMDTAPKRTGAYYHKLLPLVENVLPGEEIVIAANEQDPIEDSQISDAYGPARQQFYEMLIHKVKSTAGVRYRRIVCVPDGPDVGKLSESRFRWSFPHCEAMLRLNEESRKTVCRLSVAKSIANYDILVFGTRVAVMTLDTRIPTEGGKHRAGKSGVLIFHNPPNAQIIERLRDTFDEIDKGSAPVNSLPAARK